MAQMTGRDDAERNTESWPTSVQEREGLKEGLGFRWFRVWGLGFWG